MSSMIATAGLGLGAAALGVGTLVGGLFTAAGVFGLAQVCGLKEQDRMFARNLKNNPRLVPALCAVCVLGGILAMYSGGTAAYLLGKAIYFGTKVPSLTTQVTVLLGSVSLIASAVYKLFQISE